MRSGERIQPPAMAKAREALAKSADFAKLGGDEQEKKVQAEAKANLLAMRRRRWHASWASRSISRARRR